MNYLVIDLDAESARESFVALETRNATMVTDELFGNLVKPKSSNTWLDPLGDFAKCLSNQLIRSDRHSGASSDATRSAGEYPK